MTTKMHVKAMLALVVTSCFVLYSSKMVLASNWSDLGTKYGSNKTISSSSKTFSSTSKGGWGHHTTDSDTTNNSSNSNTVTADQTGVFNGKDYVKTETKTSSFSLHNGKEITSTTVTYYNAQGQKVGIKSTGGWADRETTFEYDANGNISKKVVTTTRHGWTNKPENGGKEFTSTRTITSTFAYEDVKDANGNVTGQKVTETMTFSRKVDGQDKQEPSGVSNRVIVTVTGTDGTEISKTITTNYTDGHKKINEKVDGQWKRTYYDKDGNVYEPPKADRSDWIKTAFKTFKEHQNKD